jgi:hypothetical protein
MKIKQYIMVNGLKMIIKDMVVGFKYGLTEVNMKDIGGKIERMLKEN